MWGINRLHHTKLPQYMKEMKKYHLAHHYKNFELGYGVTSEELLRHSRVKSPSLSLFYRQDLGFCIQHSPSGINYAFNYQSFDIIFGRYVYLTCLILLPLRQRISLPLSYLKRWNRYITTMLQGVFSISTTKYVSAATGTPLIQVNFLYNH
jgi:hypothetical protein